MNRDDAEEVVAAYGAETRRSITKATNFVVFGHQDPRKFKKGHKVGGKMTAVEELCAKGQQIEIIMEEDFLKMLDS